MKMPVHNPLVENVGLVFAVVFVALFFIQWKWPLWRQHFSALRRLVRNTILPCARSFRLPDSPRKESPFCPVVTAPSVQRRS